jgi:predicted nucleic acid-binding protein
VIVVDSSIWIAHLRGLDSPGARRLRQLIGEDDDRLIVGDVVLLEVLQGARDEANAVRIERALRAYRVVPMLDERLAPMAAEFYRRLRRQGITVCKTMDMIIGTFCIDGGHELLHDDRDFAPMAEHLGLRVLA